AVHAPARWQRLPAGRPAWAPRRLAAVRPRTRRARPTARWPPPALPSSETRMQGDTEGADVSWTLHPVSLPVRASRLMQVNRVPASVRMLVHETEPPMTTTQ